MALTSIRRFFAAAPHRPLLPEDEVRRLYPKYRWQVLQATFFGYATFYLVRNNLSVVSKDITGALGYDKGMIGSILAVTAISYGIGKFLMGTISDRSNARTFMATGLLLTAVCNLAFGAVASYPLHLGLWALNGLFQGMGWPPCGRCMGHWFGEKERGLTFSIWNTSHNLGGGIAGAIAGWSAAHYGGWHMAFYVPAVLAIVGAVFLFWRLRDTPQSVGLPPIEQYHAHKRLECSRCGYSLRGLTVGRCPECGEAFDLGRLEPLPPIPHERELTYRELLLDNVLFNKAIWLLALANFFAYITRYSMLDWGPMYLREVKGATLTGGGIAILMTEFGGIPSTILLGWVSDLIGGRRGMVAALCLVPIMGAFLVILLTPAGFLWLDMLMLATVGFFIYPVINLIVILALDLTSKKAIGCAAGFIGLFGYIGRTCQAAFGWIVDHYEPIYGHHRAWQIVITAIIICTGISAVLMALTWRMKPAGASPAVEATGDRTLAAAGSDQG